jgi:IS30 family transposase
MAQQLTQEQRFHIHVSKSRQISVKDIAKHLGVYRSTIYRELERNSVSGQYDPKQAQILCNNRRLHGKNVPVKMMSSLLLEIEERLKKYWSPKQISGDLKKNKGLSISHETIYKWIWQDKKRGGSLYKLLRHNGKKYNKRAGKTAGRGCIPNRVDISQRPSEVEKKERIGDFEGDLIMGKQGTGALISMVDRHSKILLLRGVNSKEAFEVRCAISEMMIPFKENIHTITLDNGKEFAYHTLISQALDIKIYFATPYHSWERGLNEHTNGLVRQFFPKGLDFRTLTPQDIQTVQDLINHRPREVLGFKTPHEVFFKAHGANSAFVAFDG